MPIPQTEVIVRHDGVELARATLGPGEYIIGRSNEADIYAETPLISRQHARLSISQDEFLIEDLGSSNGTFVGGKLIAGPTRVLPDQPVRLGDVQFELHPAPAARTGSANGVSTKSATRNYLPEGLFAGQRYAIGRIVARGGMGEILEARQGDIERTVAMKVMLENHGEDDVLRFIDEAKITGKLDHPNIVPIYELGVDEQNRLFYTMKLVRGITLKKVIELMAHGVEATLKKYPLPTLLTIFQKVCDAVAFAHSRSVIHRDLKPENIMLGDFGSVLVMDWGLAKVFETGPEAGRETLESGRTLIIRVQPTEPGKTPGGTVMGTPEFMAPEQARGETESLDQRADIYALGAILFEMLHLRPAVTGSGVSDVVAKVARGVVEWTDPGGGRDSAHDRRAPRGGRIPDSLLAVCRKALAFDREQRYSHVEDLQRDLTAYQTGFATSAENAGHARQLLLLVRRHKTTTIAVAVFLSILPIFTVSVLVQARRAAREAARANAALADLKKTAPSLLGLAESEARLQRFDSALAKLDDALALDPQLQTANWRRAWIFLGQEKFAEAAKAIRLAMERERGPNQFAAILPLVEELADAPDAERWAGDRAPRLLKHLEAVGASGEMVAISKKLQLGAAERLKIVKSRVEEWVGGDAGKNVWIDNAGLIEVSINNLGVDSFEPLRGLPIEHLRAAATNVSSLEPLRGMKLVSLDISGTKVADLSPLQGMPLRKLAVGGTRVRDLSPLKGAPIEELNCMSLRLTDLSPLEMAPLIKADIQDNEIASLDFLAGAPIVELNASRNMISDLSPLRGKPLRKLTIWGNRISDISPLRGTPIEMLEINGNRAVKDISPALDLPKLQRLRVSTLGAAVEPLRPHPALKYLAYESEAYRSVAEFWADYDAQKDPGAK